MMDYPFEDKDFTAEATFILSRLLKYDQKADFAYKKDRDSNEASNSEITMIQL